MSSSEWKECLLGDVAEVIGGYAFKAKDFIEDGVPVIKIKNIVPPVIDITDVQYVSDELYNEKEKYRLGYNDILISLTGSHINQLASAVGKLGRVKIKNKKLLLNQRVGKVYVKDSKNYHEEFLYYFLSQDTVRYDLAISAGGSANQANISPQDVKNISIPLPPLKEQKAIANVLSSLDDKIELNNQMNKTLEEMAQALFKRWFVDFEFPNEEGEPYKLSGGEMVDSELGMIPKGWKVGELGAFVKAVVTGKTPSTKNKQNYGNQYPFITIPDMHNRVFVTRTERYLSEQGNKTQENKLLPSKSIIVSCIATVGLVSINLYPSHTNQQINSILPKNEIDLYYFYEFLKLKEDELKAIGSTGSATLNVNKGQFEKVKCILADEELRRKYTEQVKAIFERIYVNQIENENLQETRDTLLPKLMSGEIRVKDIQS